jgi:DNA-binding XRE family transcriptional regulator
MMKTKPNKALKELRRVIEKTQGEFAAMIGASKDTVVSWERGRNGLSETFARRISLATGVEAKGLVRGTLPLMSYIALAGREPYTAQRFEQHRETYWGRSDEEAARQHAGNCADALELLFVAASEPEHKVRYRLPAVVDSFIEWCERAREDFHLEAGIEKQLGKRKSKVVITHRYSEWRRMQKEDPGACRFMGFKDDPRKGGEECLTLTAEGIPIWRPGLGMRRGKSQAPNPKSQ